MYYNKVVDFAISDLMQMVGCNNQYSAFFFRFLRILISKKNVKDKNKIIIKILAKSPHVVAST